MMIFYERATARKHIVGYFWLPLTWPSFRFPSAMVKGALSQVFEKVYMFLVENIEKGA